MFVGAITATIPSGADDGRGAAQSVAAAVRTVGVRLPPTTAEQAARLDEAHEEVGEGAGSTQMRRLIAAVLAGHDRVTVLVLRQALAAAAAEGVFRTGVAALHAAIAAQLVLAMWTLPSSVAQSSARDAATASLAAEGFRGAGLVEAGVVGALLVGGVIAVGAAVAHKEPRDAHATRAALEWK